MKTLGRWDTKNSMMNRPHPACAAEAAPAWIGNPNGIPPQSPGLARGTSAYPGMVAVDFDQPQRGCGCPRPSHPAGTPLGFTAFQRHATQGSSFLATLGWRTQSLWDWKSTRSKTRIAFTALLGVSLLAAASLHAQNFAIDWFTIDGGGGTSSGGNFSLSGTIGQPDASARPMTGGNFSLTGGFWSLFAVQTPDAPLLAIRLASANTAVVSWPSPSTGFTLQQNADLNTTNWVSVPQPVSDDGTNKFITVSPPTGKRFYRLFKP